MDRLYVLTDEERKATLSQRLVDQCHIVVHPLLELGTFNPDIVSSLPLLDRSVMRGELVNQAEAIFYGRNSFLVWWDALQEFLSPRNGLSTDKLVRRVIVRYSLQELQASRRKLATELQHLFRLTHADSITVDITGGGTPDGSDFATQMVLRDIAAIVQQLIFYFGPRFLIGRSLGEWPGAHDRMKSGEASFEETMQLQIESWIQAAKRPLCGVSGADSPLLGCGTDALTDGISLAVLTPELA